MSSERPFGRFEGEDEAFAEASGGGVFYSPRQEDDQEAIVRGIVDGLKAAASAYEERHEIVRDTQGRIISRKPLEEVIREKGPRRHVSMYQTAGFVTWQVSKRASMAGGFATDAARVWARTKQEASASDPDFVAIAAAAKRASAGAARALAAYDESHAVQSVAAADDEQAYERALHLHGLAAASADEAEEALNAANAALRRLQAKGGK